MLVLGMIGRGKSALVKSLLVRSLLYGTKGVVFDVKGEYAALPDALGCPPLQLSPGGSTRLNPLDPRSTPREQAELVEALAATALSRSLRPEERTALELALAEARTTGAEAVLPSGGRRPARPDRPDGRSCLHDPRRVGPILS
jgi:type IV secretory pathway VirB4 component